MNWYKVFIANELVEIYSHKIENGFAWYKRFISEGKEHFLEKEVPIPLSFLLNLENMQKFKIGSKVIYMGDNSDSIKVKYGEEYTIIGYKNSSPVLSPLPEGDDVVWEGNLIPILDNTSNLPQSSATSNLKFQSVLTKIKLNV